MKTITLTALLLMLAPTALFAQLLQHKEKFTRQDSLRGSITPAREWWDINHYDLHIKVDPEKKHLSGVNHMTYTALKPGDLLQIDLQPPMRITKITQDEEILSYTSEGNAHFVQLPQQASAQQQKKMSIYYEGHPREAVNAPWDGGVSWKKDSNGNHFIATSCQGLGASVWWPNKDHMYQEVDSLSISVTVPKGLTNVSNGRLHKVVHEEQTSTFTWVVHNPINNYGVNINIGDYVHFAETYDGDRGPLSMDYYVLRDHLEMAKIHFKDAKKTIQAFEHWFGPYPFYEDGYKLVEVPYLGMEHQSSVTYGNQFKKGYLGNDLSNTGIGLLFDFIIVHESGHEWFANNITNKDIADMWIHESFTAYSENLFLDYHYDTQKASDYVIGTRRAIQNDRPIIGHYNVNHEGSSDMYYKGANMLHSIRSIINNDQQWRNILRGLNKDFYHQTVTTAEIERYLSQHAGIDLQSVFDQYLRTTDIPRLRVQREKRRLTYWWENSLPHFNMPVDILLDGKKQRLYPTTKKQVIHIDKKVKNISLDKNYFANVTIE